MCKKMKEKTKYNELRKIKEVKDHEKRTVVSGILVHF